MFDQYERKAMAAVSMGDALSTTARTFTERLGDEVKALEMQLDKKRRLKALLSENPVIQEALDLMG